MVANVTKISQKMKNKSLLKIEKKYYRMRKKCLIINNNDLESSFKAMNLLEKAY